MQPLFYEIFCPCMLVGSQIFRKTVDQISDMLKFIDRQEPVHCQQWQLATIDSCNGANPCSSDPSA